jgi:hypothetical protein
VECVGILDRGYRGRDAVSESLVKILIQGVLALVLLLAMTWIVLSPSNDEATKAALVIIGTAVGFLFGQRTAT